MNYYLVSLISTNFDKVLAYQSKEDITPLSIVEVTLIGKPAKAIILETTEKPLFKCQDIQKITTLYLPDAYLSIARFMSKYYVCSLPKVLGLFSFFDRAYDEVNSLTPELTNAPILSNIQNQALEFCDKQIASLLFCDTGSGKTEIYIKAILNTIMQNKTVILLMPEISLTPQMESRLKKYFLDYVGIWHSKVNAKKRNTILEKIQMSEIKIIAGARSSLFLPIKNLGLIIVDEEHDDSYKSSSEPMYNAKDMAVYFGNTLKIPVILGSATPSIASYNKYPHFRIKGGYFSSNKDFVFTKNLIDENEFIINSIKDVFKSNKQSIIFVPTKANFKYLICKSCYEVISCPNCSISLSLYLKENAMTCHYCNHSQKIPTNCPKCKSGQFSSKKIGTSEVVKILSRYIPNAVIEQFDRNKVTTDSKLRSILQKFNDGKIDVLVGTQMISKGHDYHNVSLAVILNIDSILHMQDYRSREKTLSLFLQISGRSGRKNNGEIIIQTQNEDFFKSYLHDYEIFLKDELIFRESLYPPYKKIARILFADKNKDNASSQMQKMQKMLSSVDDIEVVGYGESPVFKIASKYRYYIFIRSDKSSALLKSIHKYKTSKSSIDIDPISFM